MARTKAVLGAGARLADHLAVAYLAMNCPLQRVRQVLQELGAQSKRRRDLRRRDRSDRGRQGSDLAGPDPVGR